MQHKITKAQLENDSFVAVRDIRTKKITSVNTLHDLRIGFVEKSAGIIVSGDSNLLGPVRAMGGMIGALTYPDGSLALIPGANINLLKTANGKVVVSAEVDLSDIEGQFAALPAIIINLSGTVSDLSGRVVALEANADPDTGFSTVSNTITTLSSSLCLRTSLLEATCANLLSSSGNAQPTVGAIGTNLAMNVALSGQIDGYNAVFTLPSVPSPSSSLMVFKNGQLLASGSDADYSYSASTVTLLRAPLEDDVLSALYAYQTPVVSYSINEPIDVNASNENYVIELLNKPEPVGSLMLFMNGQLLTAGGDYAISNKIATLDPELRDIENSRFFATYSY